MGSKKCPSCHLVNWETESTCQRCGMDLNAMPQQAGLLAGTSSVPTSTSDDELTVEEQNGSPWAYLGFALFFLFFGISMIARPNAKDGAPPPSGRHAAYEWFLNLIWGYPGGIVMIALGIVSIYAFFEYQAVNKNKK